VPAEPAPASLLEGVLQAAARVFFGALRVVDGTHAIEPIVPAALARAAELGHLRLKDMNSCSTYQNISATEAKSSSAAATWLSSR